MIKLAEFLTVQSSGMAVFYVIAILVAGGMIVNFVKDILTELVKEESEAAMILLYIAVIGPMVIYLFKG